MDGSAITCDEIIESYDEETKTISINFKEKKAICKTQNFYILLVFLLIIEQNKNIYYHFTTQVTN